MRIKRIDFVFVEAQVGAAVFHVVVGVFPDAGDFVVGESTSLSGGISHVEPATFEGLSGRDQGTRGDDHVALHHSLVEHRSMNAHKHPVVDGAAVYHGVVSDGDLIADDGRSVGVHHMDAGIVLHIAPVADANVVHVTTNGDIEPDAGFGPEHHVADDVGARRDKIGGVYLWLLVEELI